MISKLKIEDLISIVLVETKTDTEIFEYKRINILRDKLRVNGITSDLSLKEFETMKFYHPDNIIVERNRLVVKRSELFIVQCKCILYRMNKKERERMYKLWEESL